MILQVVGVIVMLSLLPSGVTALQLPIRVGTVGAEWGDGEGEGGVAFHTITGLALLPEGKMLALDGPLKELWLFETSGGMGQRLASEGEGPQELSGYSWHLSYDDSRRELWIQTESPGFAVFSHATGRWTSRSLRVVGDLGEGAFFVRNAVFAAFPDPASPADRMLHVSIEPPGDTVRIPLWRMPDSIASTPVATGTNRYGRRMNLPVRVRYAPRVLRARSLHGRVAQVRSHEYRVRRWTADGGEEPVLAMALTPVAVTSRELAREEDDLEAQRRTLMASPYVSSFPEVDLPRMKPIVRSIFFDQDERLWVELFQQEGRPRKAHVYDGGGRLLFEATWPEDVSLRFGAVRGDVAVGVRRGAHGQESVVRLSFARRKDPQLN